MKKFVKESLNEDIYGSRSWGTLAGDNESNYSIIDEIVMIIDRELSEYDIPTKELQNAAQKIIDKIGEKYDL